MRQPGNVAVASTSRAVREWRGRRPAAQCRLRRAQQIGCGSTRSISSKIFVIYWAQAGRLTSAVWLPVCGEGLLAIVVTGQLRRKSLFRPETRPVKVRRLVGLNLIRLRAYLVLVVGSLLPDDDLSSKVLRPALLRACGATIGRHVYIGGRLRATHVRLTVGDNVIIAPECYFDLAARVTIESRVGIGYGTTFVTGGHLIAGEWRREGRSAPRPITIKAGSWVGAKSVLLPGITVGPGSVVAAGSVVTRSVAPNTLVGGAPARLIRQLPTDPPAS